MATTTTSQKNQRPPKPKAKPPIAAAVERWISALPGEYAFFKDPYQVETLVAASPKRYTTYEPMVLLPSGSFSDPLWRSLLAHPNLTGQILSSLWGGILGNLPQSRSAPLTHLAVNEGIPLHASFDNSETQREGANILRSPSALKGLHGDFGPSKVPSSPSEQDFDEAFWVSTKQSGILQTWVPRWTMFSRGNVKEKERLLSFHADTGAGAGAGAASSNRAAVSLDEENSWVVDLYAGIGYFTFTYAKQGARILCWEINPWSVEALRRGARANGWSVRVVRGDELRLPTHELIANERIIIFLEDNREANRRIGEIRASGACRLNVLHVNCGLLPTSEPTWRPSWGIAASNSQERCWLHLHDNIPVDDIGRRRDVVQAMFDGWAAAAEPRGPDERKRVAHVEHVECVKTYAPGLWHCVFDVYITYTSISLE